MSTTVDFFKEAINNKDVFTSLILLGIMFMGFIPLFLHINKKQTDSIKDLTESIKNTMEQGFNRLAISHGKAIIEDDRLLTQMGERAILSATTAKLDFLRRRLIQNDIQNNQNEIKNHIKTQLVNISEKQYIEFLNRFNTKLGLFGDWISNNFPMDRFLEQVYKVFFNTELNIDRKIELIQSIMIAFQTEMWEKFKIELKQK